MALRSGPGAGGSFGAGSFSPGHASGRDAPAPERDGIVVFSGGSAANSLVDVFERVRRARDARLSYVLPVSDNGGSTSEIVRVFGGPGIGDVRSCLVRLVPAGADAETVALQRLFNHRLAGRRADARAEWCDLLEARHPLWHGVSAPKRELVRAHLIGFNGEAVKRMRPPAGRFDFARASVGNLFLTGARLFIGSFEAAIYLLAALCAVPNRVAVLPTLDSNFAHHIAAGLRDGSVIAGQHDISHPSAPTGAGAAGPEAHPVPRAEDATLPGALPALGRPALEVVKDAGPDLPARIDCVWYINPYGQEMRIAANPRVLDALAAAHSVVYSIGSLFTSLVPSLVLGGVGDAIASPAVGNRILILNAAIDRETESSSDPLTGLDFVAAIANACADSRGLARPSEREYALYVSHVVYLESPRAPVVDRQRLASLGIDTTRLYGPPCGQRNPTRTDGYDATALAQTLESIVGRKDARPDRSRRNTLVG